MALVLLALIIAFVVQKIFVWNAQPDMKWTSQNHVSQYVKLLAPLVLQQMEHSVLLVFWDMFSTVSTTLVILRHSALRLRHAQCALLGTHWQTTLVSSALLTTVSDALPTMWTNALSVRRALSSTRDFVLSVHRIVSTAHLQPTVCRVWMEQCWPTPLPKCLGVVSPVRPLVQPVPSNLIIASPVLVRKKNRPHWSAGLAFRISTSDLEFSLLSIILFFMGIIFNFCKNWLPQWTNPRLLRLQLRIWQT